MATYRLNGDATDLSGNYNGTATSVTYVAGIFGDAGSFNGSSSYVGLPSSATTPIDLSARNYTISMWINPTVGSAYGSLLSKYGSSTPSRALYTYWNSPANKVTFGENGSAGFQQITSLSDVLSGVWTHLVFTKTTTTQSMYINGTLDASAANGGIGQSTSEEFKIGATFSNGTITEVFNGSIDQVRIFNKAISDTEVTTLYNEVAC